MSQLTYFMAVQGAVILGTAGMFAVKSIRDNGGLVWSVRYAREAVAFGMALIVAKVL